MSQIRGRSKQRVWRRRLHAHDRVPGDRDEVTFRWDPAPSAVLRATHDGVCFRRVRVDPAHDALPLLSNKGAGPEIHMARSEIFFTLGSDDSARIEMQMGLDSLRRRDAKSIVYVYESKGVFEHAIGLIYERQGLPDQAREALCPARAGHHAELDLR